MPFMCVTTDEIASDSPLLKGLAMTTAVAEPGVIPVGKHPSFRRRGNPLARLRQLTDDGSAPFPEGEYHTFRRRRGK